MRRHLLFLGGALIMLVVLGAMSWAAPLWQRIGPVASWDAEIYCFAGTPSGDTLLVGTSHGIFRHPDPAGQEYMIEVNEGLPLTWNFPSGHYHCLIASLAVAPNGKIFAGSKEGHVYRSDDGGLTWAVLSQFPGSSVTSMVIDHEGKIYVGTEEEGVWLSTDDGNNWISVNDGLELYDLGIIDLAVQNDNDVVAMLWSPFSCQIMHLANGDKTTWMPRIIEGASGLGGSLRIDAVGGIYVKDYNGNLYRSGNDGINWTKNSLPDNVPACVITTCHGGHLFVCNSDSVTDNCTFFVTKDNGASWEAHTNNDIGVLLSLYHNLDGTLYAGTTSGIYSTGTSCVHPNCCTLAGDVNGDNNCSIGDAVYLIGYIFRGGQVPGCQGLSDVNGDENVNVGDAVYIVNYIFRGGPAPVQR